MTSKVNEIKIGPQPGPQTAFLSTTADICIYGGSAGAGKVQQNQSLICTPFGFKKMGDIRVGDMITNPDGSVQRVRAVYPHKDWQFYNVTFNDGTTVKCGMEHLWVAWKARKQNKKARRLKKGGNQCPPLNLYPDSAKVVSLEEIVDWMDRGYHPLIPVTSPVRYNVTNRYPSSIDPYLLGVLLGDGCITNKSYLNLTRHIDDCEVDQYFIDAGFDISCREFDNKHVRLLACPAKTKLVSDLERFELLGTRSNSKFIPREYKLGSIETREAILQGLMDTDGYVDIDGKLQYTTVSHQLALDVQEVVQSLGGWATITSKVGKYRSQVTGEIVECQRAYSLYIKLHHSIMPFRLQRKVDRYTIPTSRLYRTITKIEKAEVSDGACISVDNPNRLYLTDGFVVTHNTASLIIEPLRHLENQQFSAVIFRRTSPQILNPGGLWDESMKFYNQLGGVPSVSTLTWKFPSGMRVKFAHLEHEKDKYDWQGSQIPLIMFDEITHITEGQFTYMMSRNRSDSGVPGYIRGTCNPDPQSWVRRWIDWYIGEDGLPIQSRSGVLRYFLRINDEMVWASTKDELCLKYGETQRPFIKSFTFIAATIYDNKILLEKDPSYLASLMSLPRIERERLLGGNWDVTAQGSKYFSREWTPVVPFPSCRLIKVRYWDRAASEPSETNPTPDWSVGTLFGKDNLTGTLYILDVVRFQGSPFEVKRRIRETQKKDGYDVRTIIEQDPGGAGKTEAFMLRRDLAEGGYEVRCRPVTKDKLTRFLPFSAAAEHGDIKVVQGPWNEPFFVELERFQGDGKGKDDQVDTCSGGYAELVNKLESPIFALGSITKTHSFQIV